MRWPWQTTTPELPKQQGRSWTGVIKPRVPTRNPRRSIESELERYKAQTWQDRVDLDETLMQRFGPVIDDIPPLPHNYDPADVVLAAQTIEKRFERLHTVNDEQLQQLFEEIS